ncbi:MAG: phage portal protein [Alphaproteobacteria bacterium]|nr:phage portal protein [Alphaproteobacteria bacterium]
MGLSDLVTRMLRPAVAQAMTGRPPQLKTSRAGPMIAWSNVGQPKWTPRRSANLAEEGFKKNTVAYRCVMQIATAASAIPWLLYDEQGNEIDTHPLLDLITHPNPLQDGVAFMESVYANLQISGNAYIEAIRPQDGETPVELYVLRPDRMTVIPGPAGLPQGYQYNVNGQVTQWAADPLTGACDILHLKTFNPLDDWYGMAPMEAALQSIDQHNASGAWNQALLNQGARPSGALVYAPKDGGPATLSDDQLQRLREEMSQLYQGDRNAGRPLILEGGLDWREMSLSPKDMDWLAGRNNAARDIALAFGVPAQLIGLPEAQTFSNMEQARLAFYEETVVPMVTRVIAGFDHWLCPMYADAPELDYDPDSIGALIDQRQAQWSKIGAAAFLTLNEQRAAAGYGPLPESDAKNLNHGRAKSGPFDDGDDDEDDDFDDFENGDPDFDSGDDEGDDGSDTDQSNNKPEKPQRMQVTQEIPPVIDPELTPSLPGIGDNPLPANPDDLLDQGYQETSHPDAAAAGHRTFENPDTGDILRFDEGDPEMPGYRGEDHYHRPDPDSPGDFLDQNGDPARDGSPASHLFPKEIA